MGEWPLVVFLFVGGGVILIAELFLPAHGLLGIVGAGMLMYGLYETFQVSQTVGIVASVLLAIGLPAGLIVSVRTWHRTPIGRRISPPNRALTPQDRLPGDDLAVLVGRTGRSVTPLRPVGTCLFGGHRVECMSEYGMIEKNVDVEGVRVVDRTLSVREVPTSSGVPAA